MRIRAAFVLALTFGLCAWAQTRFEVSPQARIDPGLPAIRWVSPDDSAWSQGPADFVLGPNEAGTSAKGYLAATAEALKMRVVVHDDVHFCESVGSNSWHDDAIQLGIDALDNGMADAPRPVNVEAELGKRMPAFEKTDAQIQAMDRRERRRWEGKKRDWQKARENLRKNLERYNRGLDIAVYLQWDDADFCFSKTSHDDTPSVWSYYHGQAGHQGPRPRQYVQIARDASSKTTTYDIRIPWSELGLDGGGLTGAIRLAMKIHDRDEKNGPENELWWGGGVGGKFQPFDFKRLALEAPPAPYAVAYVDDRAMYEADEEIVCYLGATQGTWDLEMRYGRGAAAEKASRQLRVESAAMGHYYIRVAPGALPEGVMDLTLRLKQDGKTVAQSSRGIYSESMENWYAWTTQENYKTTAEEREIERKMRSRSMKLTRRRDQLSPAQIAQAEKEKHIYEIPPEVEKKQLALFGDSKLDMAGWLDAPAGVHGRPEMVGEKFVVNGKEMKIWGVNVGSGGCMPAKSVAVAQARKYAKYGINCVRLHKFSPQLNSLDDTGFFDPAQLDRLDYFTAQLKKQGVYYQFDPFFHHVLSPYERKQVEHPEDFVDSKGKPRNTYAVINISRELQDLRLKWIKALMNHVNPYTGLAYKDDPALASVEFQNEDGIFFYSTGAAVLSWPRYGRQFARRYSDWLKEKYGTHERLVEAWGADELSKAQGQTAYYFMTKRLFPGQDEHLDKRNIIAIANPWFFTPYGLMDQQRNLNIRERLLDNLQFLLQEQKSWYARFDKALEDLGYDGPVTGSCWIAAEGVTHYANLYTDAWIGYIDRHDYMGGGYKGWWITTGDAERASLTGTPGGGTLDQGFNQVKGRPFALSEWTVVFPSQWRADGTSLVALYGMGLGDWDASYQFAAGDGNWSSVVSRGRWDVNLPDNMGLYPALARMVYRGDIKPGEVISVRKVAVDDMVRTGQLGFAEQAGAEGFNSDFKTLGGFVPTEALAVGRCLVEFVEEPQPSTGYDVEEARQDGTLVATNGQLRWKTLSEATGYVLVDSAGTKAVVGFAPPGEYELGGDSEKSAVRIGVNNHYATVFVTSLDRSKDLSDCNSALIQAVARARNTGMRYSEIGHRLVKMGTSPVVLEPVRTTIGFQRPVKTVNVLDHDGRRTGRQVPVKNNQIRIDTAVHKTPYYEVIFK
jgi:hypothetical protein